MVSGESLQERNEEREQISIVIPARNEATRISSTLEALMDIFSRDVKSKKVEIIIVMPGCTDDTPKIVNNFAKEHPWLIKPVLIDEDIGKGGALMKGMEIAKGDILILLDADLPVEPTEIIKAIKMMEKYDLILGSRYTYGAKIYPKPSYLRLLFSKSFNIIVRLLFQELRNIKDTQCGVKLLSRRLFNMIKPLLMITGFAFDVNLICAAIKFNARVKELGVTWRHNEYGSKISRHIPKLALKMLLEILKLKVYLRLFNKRGTGSGGYKPRPRRDS